jgi:hypothetical protein
MSTYDLAKRSPKKLIYYWAIGRFFIPFFVFNFPLFTTIVADLLDRCDSLFAYNAGWSWKKYLVYDKIFDEWWYIFILLFSINKYIFTIIGILFVYRTLGQIISIFTKNSKVLIFSPNILELYFWVYVASAYIFHNENFLSIGINNLTVLIFCTILAIVREYYIHINSHALEKLSYGKSWIKNS